ncbi:MAG: hypothetical protein H7834_09970 [Magnetococcus sp. YQC-9]
MATITATTVLNFAYPSGGGGSDHDVVRDDDNSMVYDMLYDSSSDGLVVKLQELLTSVGSPEELALMSKILDDIQANGNDPATLATIQELMETGLSGLLQDVLNDLEAGRIDGAIDKIKSALSDLQQPSGDAIEISRLEDLIRDGESRWDATINTLRSQLDEMRRSGMSRDELAAVERQLEEAIAHANEGVGRLDGIIAGLTDQLQNLREHGATREQIEALEKRLEELTSKPGSGTGGSGGTSTTLNTPQVSIVRSLPCLLDCWSPRWKPIRPFNICWIFSERGLRDSPAE